MIKIPRVALFIPDAKGDLGDLFRKHEYALRQVNEVSEISALVVEETSPFDVIVIPLRLEVGTSAITVALQLRDDPLLGATPIVVLSPSKDTALLQTIYGAGADYVCVAPYDADSLYLQICALTRLKRAFDEKINEGLKNTGLYHPVMHGFQSVREGLLLFDSHFKLIFVNHSAIDLLGLSADPQTEELERIGNQFVSALKEHDSRTRLNLAPNNNPQLSTLDCSVTRVDGQSFKGSLSIASLQRERKLVLGFSLAITDLSEVQHLANTLLQAQRTRSLCLFSVAAVIHFLSQAQQQFVLSPFKVLEGVFQQTAKNCPLNAMLTALLEAVDLMISPRVNVRVKVDKDLFLAIKPSDFLQLVGHLLLHAIEHAGASGEVSLHTSDNVPGEGVIVTVTSESKKVTPFIAEDQIARLIKGDLSSAYSSFDAAEQVSYGLLAAEKIARAYRTQIEYQQPSANLMKMRVKLPLGKS